MTSGAPNATAGRAPSADAVTLPSADPYDVHLEYVRRGWSDGLPVIPATPERVGAMLESAPDTDEQPPRIPPRGGLATLEALVIQAVMAGCEPKQFPVVVAAVRAMTHSRFNLTTIQSTTHSAAPLVIVNGPSRARLGFHGGAGCLGPGFQANATVGRALRLVLLNIGGGRPGDGDFASQGHPGKFSFCAAENEEQSPWEPMHVDAGYARSDNTVTVFGAGAPINVNNHVGGSATHILDTVADSMCSVGGNILWRVAYGDNGEQQTGEWIIALTPEHAATIADDGWSKDDVRRYIFEYARIPSEKFRASGMWGMHQAPKWLQLTRPGIGIPVVAAPERVVVMVLGGAGKHSSCIPTHSSASRSVMTTW